jgi:hypothetical protein
MMVVGVYDRYRKACSHSWVPSIHVTKDDCEPIVGAILAKE